MKKVELQVKAGFAKDGDVSKQEIKEAGYDVKETDSKIYAVKEIETDLPENLDEMVNDIGREATHKYALSTYRVREIFDPVRNEMKSKLNKEVPKNVQQYLDTLMKQAEASYTPFTKQDIEGIPYEAKLSTDLVDNYLEDILA